MWKVAGTKQFLHPSPGDSTYKGYDRLSYLQYLHQVRSKKSGVAFIQCFNKHLKSISCCLLSGLQDRSYIMAYVKRSKSIFDNIIVILTCLAQDTAALLALAFSSDFLLRRFIRLSLLQVLWWMVTTIPTRPEKVSQPSQLSHTHTGWKKSTHNRDRPWWMVCWEPGSKTAWARGHQQHNRRSEIVDKQIWI